MKRTNKINLYYGVDIMAFSAVLLAVAVYYKKAPVDAPIIAGLGAMLIALYQAKIGETKINNQSHTTITAKDESSSDTISVPPHSSAYNIDGIRVGDKVYKRADGTHSTLYPDGRLRTHSLTGKFLNAIDGHRLPKAPDKGWDKLFTL